MVIQTPQPPTISQMPVKTNLGTILFLLPIGLSLILITCYIVITLFFEKIGLPEKLGLFSLISLFLGLSAAFIIKQKLHPLYDLYQGISILGKGEFGYRFNIRSQDELSDIGNILNQVAAALEESSQKSGYNNALISAERNKLNTIISSIIDGIIVLDLHKQVVLLNKSAEKMTGYLSQELIGKPIDNFITFKDKNSQLVMSKDYCQTVSDPTRPPVIPLSVYMNGKIEHGGEVRMAVAQVSSGVQSDLGCILILHDVAQEKLFEQMQIDFVSMASHEVRTPLTSIINYMSVVAEEGKDKLDPELRGYLDRALISAKELSFLVQNFLSVAKIERGSFAINLKPLDWSKKLAQLVEDNKAIAIQKNITVIFNPPTNPLPNVMADEIRISEVINNLIGNAINYTKEGGNIRIGTQVREHEIITYVSDNGIGIPQDSINHLFTKFFRVPGALERTESSSKGSGLGLYIAKSIVDMHHGRIWVESELGKGSTFYFTLQPAASSGQTTIINLHSTAPTTLTPS